MDFEFVLCHVGGGDDSIGPPDKIAYFFPNKVRLVVFEARSEVGQTDVIETVTGKGVKKTLITTAIDEDNGIKDFYSNVGGLSSSLLPPSNLSIDEDPNYPWCKTWGENTQLEQKIKVHTRTLDELIEESICPPPDFLSIDAQGAELRIQRGAIKALKNSILGLVTEVEFFEIYKDQCLFSDQFNFLGKEGFRFVDLVSEQRWHPGPPAGAGFLTVGEALYIKYAIFKEDVITESSFGCVDAQALSPIKLIKIAMIALSFQRYSYCYSVMEFVAINWVDIFEEVEADIDICILSDLYKSMKNNMPKFEEDRQLFLRNLQPFRKN
jgi:FkbM family methyltransferase